MECEDSRFSNIEGGMMDLKSIYNRIDHSFADKVFFDKNGYVALCRRICLKGGRTWAFCFSVSDAI